MQNNNTTNVWSNTTTTKAKHTWKTSANTERTKQQVKHILATEEFQTKLQSLTRTNSQTRAATKTEILVRLLEELGYGQQAQAVKDYQNNQTNVFRINRHAVSCIPWAVYMHLPYDLQYPAYEQPMISRF